MSLLVALMPWVKMIKGLRRGSTKANIGALKKEVQYVAYSLRHWIKMVKGQ